MGIKNYPHATNYKSHAILLNAGNFSPISNGKMNPAQTQKVPQNCL